jgi:riboflavin kinase / FMN adenylyltransferase
VAESNFIVARDPVSAPLGLADAVAAIGNFDGLHRGHRGVIARAQNLAIKLKKPCVLLTFEPHPADIFAGEKVIFRLTPPQEKAAQAAKLGLDGMIILNFDRAFSQRSASEFTELILSQRLKLSAVVAGYDFRFGAGRLGDGEFLQKEGARLGFIVDIVDRITQDEAGSIEAVSSTATREALIRGDVVAARNLLGHPYFIRGLVRHGEKRGRELGFPTANIQLDPSNRLAFGIYAVTIMIENKIYKAVASYGRRPTFDNGPPLLEVFVFDFDATLYDKDVEVAFYGFIRGEEKFANKEALIAQMHKDCLRAREILMQK